MNRVTEFIPTRHSLLHRLKDWDDQESWKQFFETYWKLIYNTAVRAGLTDSEAQDTVQETIISVMKSMPAFEYNPVNGSFKAWLLQLTSWRIVDQFRKREKSRAFSEASASDPLEKVDWENIADPAASLESSWNKEWEKNLIDAALEKIKASVDSKQYQIFDLYFIQKWPVLKIARVLDINPGRVYLIKHRVTRRLKKEISRLQTKTI